MSGPPTQPLPGTRLVRCVKLGRDLPGMAAAPFPNELGRRLYEQVSQEAWAQWIAHSRMVINEYRLNLSTPEGRKSLQDHCEQFFFGSGGTPPDYAPPTGSEPSGGSRTPG